MALMSQDAQNIGQSSGWRGNLSIAAKRFAAWWEGYAFDETAERASLKGGGELSDADIADLVAIKIWGDGRLDPGNPSWTMRHARSLGLSVNAKVAVLGAGAGAPIRDLKTGARWKVQGYSHFRGKVNNAALRTYDTLSPKSFGALHDGALAFFELHKSTDPASLAAFAAEIIKQNGPVSFIDFTTTRNTRLSSCFAGPWKGAPRTNDDTSVLLEAAGLRVSDAIDETQNFTPLVSEAWARWRHAYDFARAMPSPRSRAHYLQLLAAFAKIWAEAFRRNARWAFARYPISDTPHRIANAQVSGDNSASHRTAP